MGFCGFLWVVGGALAGLVMMMLMLGGGLWGVSGLGWWSLADVSYAGALNSWQSGVLESWGGDSKREQV